jgi:hypothetical protein
MNTVRKSIAALATISITGFGIGCAVHWIIG